MPPLAVAYPIVAGIASGIGSAVLTVDFARAVIIATITGIIAAVGTILGAMISSRAAERAVSKHADPIKADTQNLKAALNVDRRATDTLPAAPRPTDDNPH